MAIDFQSGIRRFNKSIDNYTGMLGGLTADYNTLKSLNPLTTNRVRIVMFRAPMFMMMYYSNGDMYNSPELNMYRKAIEYFNTGVNANIGDATLATAPLQGGYAGRQINIPTVQNAQTGQTLDIMVPEWVGRPIANFHNMWVNGISDKVTGLTTYHGVVSGGDAKSEGDKPQRIFYEQNGSQEGLDPSPANEVAEFLVFALDRSGARVEAAAMALGCIPAGEVGNDIFTMNATGNSQIQTLTLRFNCQYIQSAYVNDLAARYARQFAIFGNSLNLNPGAGDAFFNTRADLASNTTIHGGLFGEGKRPYGDPVQSAVGNAPAFYAQSEFAGTQYDTKALTPNDHFVIHQSPEVSSDNGIPIENLAQPGDPTKDTNN